MIKGERKITQEMYERNKDRGVLYHEEDIDKVFTQAEVWGYGIYFTQVYAGDDGNYYVRYEMGDSCD